MKESENVTRDMHDKRGDLLLYIVNGEGLHYNCSYLVLIQLRRLCSHADLHTPPSFSGDKVVSSVNARERASAFPLVR